MLLLAVPDNSATQSYLSSCNAQCLSSLFLNEFTEGAVTTEKGRLFHSFVILTLNEYFLGLSSCQSDRVNHRATSCLHLARSLAVSHVTLVTGLQPPSPDILSLCLAMSCCLLGSTSALLPSNSFTTPVCPL